MTRDRLVATGVSAVLAVAYLACMVTTNEGTYGALTWIINPGVFVVTWLLFFRAYREERAHYRTRKLQAQAQAQAQAQDETDPPTRH